VEQKLSSIRDCESFILLLDMIIVLAGRMVLKPTVLKTVEAAKQAFPIEGELFEKLLRFDLLTMPNKPDVLNFYFELFTSGINETPSNLKNLLQEIEHYNGELDYNLLNKLI
jgi:hypothetical protein